MTARMRLLFLRVLCVAAFAVLGVVQFPEVLTGETRWDERFGEYVPWRVEAARLWRAGEIPFFTDRIFGGTPMLAFGYAGILYPPNVLYALVPPPRALQVANLLYVFHTVVGGIGMMMLLRARRLRPFACFAGAMFFAAGTFGLCHSSHISMREAAMVAPWVAWAARRAAMRVERRRIAVLALAVCTEVLVGYAQVLLFALCWAGIEALCVLGPTRKGLVRAGALALGVAAGLALAAPQLATGAAVVSATTRSSLEIELWQHSSFDPEFAPHLLVPRALSEPDSGWLRDEYRGELVVTVNGAAWTLALAAVALAIARRDRARLREGVVLWAGIGLAFLLATGKHFAPNALLFHVPPFNLFRIPSRWLWLAGSFACVLAAHGIHLLLEIPRDRRPRLAAAATVAAAFPALACICGVLHFASLDDTSARFGEWIAARPSVALAHLVLVALPLAAAFLARRWPPLAAAVVFAVLAAEYRWLAKATLPPTFDPGFVAGSAPHPVLDGIDPADVSRILPLRLNGAGENAMLLPQATNLFLGWPVLTGYAPMTHRNFGYWPRLSSNGGSWRFNDMFDNPSPPGNFGVSHLLIDLAPATPEQRASFDARIGSEWEVVRRAGDVVFVRLLRAPGRFHLAPKWLAQSDPAEIDVDWWNRDPPRLQRAILVQTENPPGFPPAGLDLPPGTVQVVDARGGSSMRLRVRTPEPGVLMVRDAWWPGWEARAVAPNAVTDWVEVAEAQGMMRAVGVPAGESVVELRYVPPGWRKGLPCAAAAAILVAALLFRPRRRHPPPEAFA